MREVICEVCGGTIKEVNVWPFCGGKPEGHKMVGFFGDAPLEPYFDEHLSTEGEWITTRGQRRKIMERENFEFKKKVEKPHGSVLFFDMGRR